MYNRAFLAQVPPLLINNFDCHFFPKAQSEATCPEFVPPENGYIIPGSCQSSFGSLCVVACNSSYDLVGDDIRYCHIEDDAYCDDAFWSGETAQCLGNVYTCTRYVNGCTYCSYAFVLRYAIRPNERKGII